MQIYLILVLAAFALIALEFSINNLPTIGFLKWYCGKSWRPDNVLTTVLTYLGALGPQILLPKYQLFVQHQQWIIRLADALYIQLNNPAGRAMLSLPYMALQVVFVTIDVIIELLTNMASIRVILTLEIVLLFLMDGAWAILTQLLGKSKKRLQAVVLGTGGSVVALGAVLAWYAQKLSNTAAFSAVPASVIALVLVLSGGLATMVGVYKARQANSGEVPPEEVNRQAIKNAIKVVVVVGSAAILIAWMLLLIAMKDKSREIRVYFQGNPTLLDDMYLLNA